MSNTLELWPWSSLCLVCCVLSCVCAWLYAFRLLVTGCCCRERRLPWQANHSPHPHLPSGLGWSQVNSWAWSYTRWKGKLGREPVSWAWWVLGGVEGREMQWRAMYLAAALSPWQKGSLLDARSWSHPSSSSPLFKTSWGVSWVFFMNKFNVATSKFFWFVTSWKSVVLNLMKTKLSPRSLCHELCQVL